MNAKIVAVVLVNLFSWCSCFFLNGPLGNVVTLRNSTTNSTAVNLDVNLLNIPFEFTFDSTNRRVGRRHEICDDFILFRSPGAILKSRKAPKGMCDSCCNIDSTDVKFVSHKSGSQDRTVLYLQDIIDKKPLNLHKEASTIIYIHGFLEHPPYGSSETIRDVYLARAEPVNVILVDWSQLCAFPWYFHAVDNTKIVGKVLATFLANYHALGEVHMDQVHLIGFSLGAHVAGFAGKYLRDGGLRLRRITGLDPALPGYPGGPSTRLSKMDADFVDVIHSDGGSFGQLRPIGHVDFYPNGGTYYQPGCSYKDRIRLNSLGSTISCSHMRAWELYAESVLNPTNFPAVKCKWAQGQKVCDRNIVAYMGVASNKRDEGSFYLTTNGDSPFGRREISV